MVLRKSLTSPSGHRRQRVDRSHFLWPKREPQAGVFSLQLSGCFDFALILFILTIVPLASSAAAPARGLIPGKQASPETIQLRKIEAPPVKQEPGWGEPVDGVSVRLATDHTNWRIAGVPAFTLALQNQGFRKLTVFQIQETGRLEMDGIW